MNLLILTTFVSVWMQSLAVISHWKGRFDTGKTRAHYVLMPLHNPAHWSRYTRVLQGSNVPMAEVVVENGYRMHGVQDGPSSDGFGGNEEELGVEGEASQDNMDLDGQLT